MLQHCLSSSAVSVRSFSSLVMSRPRCPVAGCERLARRTSPMWLTGNACTMCGQKFCNLHHQDPRTHWCPFMDSLESMQTHMTFVQDEERRFNDTVDPEHFRRIACELRPGHSCVLEEGPMDWKKRMGGSNIHIPLLFDDGVKWIARVRKIKCYTPPAAAMWLNADSEAATLHALHCAGLRVPDAWRCPTDSVRRSQLPYLFETGVEGRVEAGTIRYKHCHLSNSDQYADIRKKVMEWLVDWHMDLEKVSFDRVGSLTYNGEGFDIGPEITRQPLGANEPLFPGPFKHVKQRNLSIIDHFLELSAGGETYNPKQALHAYLIFLEVREWVDSCHEMEQGPWLVMHGEPKGDHVLFDEDWNVTSAIDWEWARTSSKFEVFHAPLFYLSPLFKAQGVNDPSRWEQDYAEILNSKGRADLVEIALRGCRKYQRLDQLFRCGPNNLDIHSLNALERSFAGLPDTYAVEQPGSMEEWVERASTNRRGNFVLETLSRAAEEWNLDEPLRKDYATNKQRAEAPARIQLMKERSAARKKAILGRR